MQITSLLKSVSQSLPVGLGLELSDDGYSTDSDTSDDSSDSGTEGTPANETRPSGQSALLNVSYPTVSRPYLLPTVGGGESNNKDNVEEPKPKPSISGAVFFVNGTSTYLIFDMPKAEDDAEWQTSYQQLSDPFMMENEDLKSQLATQNPWRTLARYRNPLKKTFFSLSVRFPLLRLPAELLLIVADHLPRESAVCLALACKATYSALGNASFKMSKPELWNLLLLLEQERQNSYACSSCLTLHRPAESHLNGRHRCCWLRGWLRDKTVTLVLPHTISPGLVKMIGRKWLESPMACEEYLSWVRMREKKTTRYIKLATHVNPRMLNGSLVLRTETYIHAFVDGHLTERSLVELAAHVRLTRSVHTDRPLPGLCCHQEWESHLPNLTALKMRIKPTKCVDEDHGDYHRARCYSNERLVRTGHGQEYPMEMCDLIHKQPCRTWKIQTPSSRTRTLENSETREDFRPKLEDTYDGDIMGCRKCITDFCVSACDVPGLGYCLVLTTWKDLGGVGAGFSDKWNYHIRNNSWGEDDDVRSEDQVGQAYEAFENLERSHLGAPQRYRPQPDRKMVRDLTRRVHKSSYSIERDDTTDTDAGTETEDDGGNL